MLTSVYNSCMCPLFLLYHVRNRNFGVLLEHAGHQAVTPDVIDALKQREEKRRHLESESCFTQLVRLSSAFTLGLTWLMSLVHAAFSWRDGASRTTEND